MNDVQNQPPTESNGTAPGLVADAVRDLEKELRAQGARRWLRRLGVLLVVAAIVGGVVAYRKITEPPPPARFVTEKVEKRDVVEQVEATGAVKPLKEVQVGAQVSGRIVKVHVDFNSHVSKGDLLAEIDPSLFGAQVSQNGAQLKAARASLERAKARLETSKQDLLRAKNLKRENVASQAQVDQAQGATDVAEADVAAAKAQISQIRAALRSSRTTLAYTRIYSPIDGVVINRAIDPGQTVAAGFSTPVLFVIAQDLSKMQVLADIDEADVGRLKEKMKGEVVVDAFPGEKFEGVVTQIRFSPNNVQGVVTYSAVVDVANPELKLRPGMTATVTIRTKEALGVAAVKNSALRFRPAPKKDENGKPVAGPPPKKIEHHQGRVYLSAGGEPGKEKADEKIVEIGVSDGVWTELKDDQLPVGTEVVVEERGQQKKRGFRLF